ncbi:PREDICTED: myosin-6-like [Lupinus angustifolius]|uniref:myosin-6-like n=1 Tax=Lupinus angustifolius TaxID=3871 RepID=UPI00092E8197|nr:PREDICTED: myosin-6-like [Lupinus angustifolius]
MFRSTKLGNPRTFHYLNQSNCFELEGLDESKQYHDTRRAMGVVGINSEEQEAIFRVVAAILHLGNIEFTKGMEMDSSMPKDEKSRFHLQTAAELFMCNPKVFEDSLCERVIVTRDETITKCLDPEAAALSRDALAKIVYTRLFDWLVHKINSSIGKDPESKSLIGVLDISGFESFKTNSFEQFCINLTNEKLQQHFNQHVFKMEQEEYKNEEIDWSYIEFFDNQDIINLIEKKPGGIIALLDEACMFPRSTHETFAQKLHQTFKNHKRFSKPKLAHSDFTIGHYAGDVTYQTELFLDKNKDYVVAKHQALLYTSNCPFISGLFPPSPDEPSKQSKFSSIGTQYKEQLISLLDTISATEPHYIRCGVMEAIRISFAGFPTRKPFDEFLDRFGLLIPEALDGRSDEVTACKRILEKIGNKGYQIGKTKVFLRAGQMAELETRRSEVLGKSASIIQRKVSSYLAHRSFVLLRLSARQIQAACRGHLARQVYEGLRWEASSLMIQRYFRMHIARKAYTELYSSAVSIQTGMQGLAAGCDLRFRKQTSAAIVIQAARETGALQAAKNKLEKQVEDLTLRLQLEKCMRLDMEVTKSKENQRLQSALQEMHLQFKETKILLQKEREAAERVPVIQEVPVVDNALLEKLTSENKKLKTLVSYLERKIDETEKRYEEASKISEENLITAMQRLEENFSDIESENQVLRQQPLLNSSVKMMSQPLSSQVSEKLENGHHVAEEQKAVEIVTPEKKFETESDSTLRRSYIELQHENVDALVNCVMKNVGFYHGKPVAVFTIYICLLHWKLFEAERTSVFDRLIQMIGFAIENEDDNDLMAYWLSNTSVLLFLLQQSLTSGGSTDAIPVRKPPNPTSLFGRMTKGFRSSPSSANLPVPSLDVVHKVEAKYPALLFKQQLAAYVEKIYGTLRDNLKKELAFLLSLCIQAPSTSKGVLKSTQSFDKDSPMGHWQSIIESLNTLLCTLKENFVPPILIRRIFTQTFSYINVQLLNSLLLRRECCTFSNGEYVRDGLAELELWCTQAKGEYAGSSQDELKHIREAVGLLVIHQKYRISYEEIINDLCPVMSVQQLYRICTLYWDDIYNTPSVSPDVLSCMRVLMAEDSNNAQSDSFLLDDNSSSIPFSVDDLSTSLQVKDFSDMKTAHDLLHNHAFPFLNKEA